VVHWDRGYPLPGSLGQPESQISDQGDTCCISGFTLDHPLSPLDEESASPSQLTSREEGPTEQTGYTSVTHYARNEGRKSVYNATPPRSHGAGRPCDGHAIESAHTAETRIRKSNTRL